MNTEIDRQTVKQIREDVDQALALIGKKHGLTFTVGNISFTSTTVRFSANGAAHRDLDVAGEIKPVLMNEETKDYLRYAGLYGLKPEWLNKTFIYKGHRYTVTGLHRNRPKFPISVCRGDGKKFKFPASVVSSKVLFS